MVDMNASSVRGKVRDNHIVKDNVTSRDLFGIVRGRCSGCSSCGKYIIYTKEKYYKKAGDVHPDCDMEMIKCSRCDCPADFHEVDEVENERERGNDAVSLEDYDKAICHYTRAIELNNVDWRLWSNRSKCYSAKKWYSQALSDAERACLLDNNNFKVWYRKSVALKGLSKYKEALSCVETSFDCLSREESPKPGDMNVLKSLQRDLIGFLRRNPGQSQFRLKHCNQESQGAHQFNTNFIGADIDRNEALTRSVILLESAVSAAVETQQQKFLDINARLDRIESLLERNLRLDNNIFDACIASEEDRHVDDVSPSDEAQSLHDLCADREPSLEPSDISQAFDDDSSISRSSSSASSFLEAIQSIQNAWDARIESDFGCKNEAKPVDADLEGVNVSPDPNFDIVNQRQYFDSKGSKKFRKDYQDRMARVKKAEERMARADDSGEPLSSTDIDSLTQQKRRECMNCENHCTGFKIYYKSTDVHDPEIMFYCSLCGCKSEDHKVDPLWQNQEELRRQREDQEAKMRAERLKSRHSRISESSIKRQEAFTVLNLQPGSAKSEIRLAYKRLAKRFHPDKQKDKSNKEDIAYMQQLFTRVTDAYKLLMEDQ